MTRIATLIAFALLLLAAAPQSASATRSAGVSMEVLVHGSPLAEYRHGGRRYVEAGRGDRYSVRLTNHTGRRVAAALAVDGLNTIDASRTTATDARKWIIEPYSTIIVQGWQVSDAAARRFLFTTEQRSYGQWLGQTRNLGMISAVFFAESANCCYEPAPVTRDDRDYDWNLDGLLGSREAEEAPRRAQKSAPSATAAGDEARSGARTGSRARREPSDRAATGIGSRVNNDVVVVDFDFERSPMASLDLRYGFHDELVELGVLPKPWRPSPLSRRETSTGFAPDPGRCCR